MAVAVISLSLGALVPPASALAPTSADWVQWATLGGAPAQRSGASMVYDAATDTVVLFGGANGNFLNGTWTWNGSVWTKLSPASSPAAREGAAMAYDAATHDVVLFGGLGANGPLGDTWTWNGTTWTASTATGPVARSSSSLAYDAATHDVVLFAGLGANGPLGDTWTWNGTTWTRQSAASPPARAGAAMAYDAGTGTVVLFGADAAADADTWAWNGTYWYSLSTSTSPPARAGAAMAYDAGTGTVVLFGGVAGTNMFGDTWSLLTSAGPPRDVVATSNANGRSSVTWSPPRSDGGGAIASYLVEAVDTTTAANGGQTCTATGVTICDVTGLVNGDHYVFDVSAITVAGAGSVTPSTVAIPATVPTAPGIVTVVTSQGAVTASWSAPTTTGGTPIASYRVVAEPGGAFCHVPGTTRNCVITGLRAGARYTFTVSAANAAGTGPVSVRSASILVRSVPEAPTITSVRVVRGRITLHWRWPRFNGGSRVLGYNVYVGPVPGAETSNPLNATLIRRLTYSFRGRKGYRTFIYVRATNVVGVGAASNQVMVVTP